MLSCLVTCDSQFLVEGSTFNFIIRPKIYIYIYIYIYILNLLLIYKIYSGTQNEFFPE